MKARISGCPGRDHADRGGMRRNHRIAVGGAAASAAPAAVGTAASAAPSTAPSAAAGPTTLRVSRISDFLPSIHPVELGTGNQELMADIVFSTLVDVDKDEVTILPDLAETWDGVAGRDDLHVPPEPGRGLERRQARHRRRRRMDDRLGRPEPGRVQADPGSRCGSTSRAATTVKGTTNIPEGIKKIDANTVEITLKAPDSTFLRRIAGAVYYILPKHILDGPDRRAGGDLPVLPGHRRRDDRLRPVRLHRVDLRRWRDASRRRRTTGRARTRRSTTLVYKIQESNVSVGPAGRG